MPTSLQTPPMKKYIIVALLAVAPLCTAQRVTLSKAEKTNTNTDKFLYKIDPAKNAAQYLGEVEVEGYTENDPEIFSQIYKKAKLIGANAFALRLFPGIDTDVTPFNPSHYRISLYYSGDFPKETNSAYLFSSGDKPQKIRVDGKRLILRPRSYIKKVINFGGENSITAGNLLGSRINLSAKEGQPVQYFQISPFDVKADQSGQGGINVKSGDIIGLERSYAEFLSVIYKAHR